MVDQIESWNSPSTESASTERPLAVTSAPISTQPSMSTSPSSFAARARRAEREAARALEAINNDRPNHNLNSPGRPGRSLFTKFKPATKTKGAKAWLPFDLFSDAESTEGDNSANSNIVREYSALARLEDMASAGVNQKAESAKHTPDSLQEHAMSPEPAKPSSESLGWSVDAQFDVEEWDPDLPPGPEDPTILETMPLAPKLIDFSGLGPTNKPYISALPSTNGSDIKKENKAMQAPKPLGLPFSYPENTKMHHFGSGPSPSGPQTSNMEGEQRVGTEEAIKWPVPSRKVFSMRVPVPREQTQEEAHAALGVQPTPQSEGPRYQTQEETLAALGVQPPVQSDQIKTTTPSRPTHDQILSNLFTVEDLLKQDKVEEEMQARGMSISIRGIETVQRLAGFPNPLQQLAKSRLAGYALAKAEKAAKAGKPGGRSAQIQVRRQQHDPLLLGQGSQRSENSFPSTGTAYRFDSSGCSNKGVMQSNFSSPSSQQLSQGNLLHHRERASYNMGAGMASRSDAPSDIHRRESIQYSSPSKASQHSQNIQAATSTSSREILLKGLQKAITEAEESSLAAHDSSSLKPITLPISDLTPLPLKASITAPAPPLSSTRSSATRGRSNIECIGPSDPLPWKERPVHIHTVINPHATAEDSTEMSKPAASGLHATTNGPTWMNNKCIDGPPHFAVNRRARPMLEVASQWWREDKRPDADLRKHLQAIADQDLNESSRLKNEQWPAIGAKSPQNIIPEGYCASHLLILLLGSLHEYLVDSPNEQRAMFGSFVEVPEWCVEKGTSGLTSFFGEDWGIPPQRVGRDPRYRPLMHDPRFMFSYDEQEYWNRSEEQWPHARRYR